MFDGVKPTIELVNQGIYVNYVMAELAELFYLNLITYKSSHWSYSMRREAVLAKFSNGALGSIITACLKDFRYLYPAMDGLEHVVRIYGAVSGFVQANRLALGYADAVYYNAKMADETLVSQNYEGWIF